MAEVRTSRQETKARSGRADSTARRSLEIIALSRRLTRLAAMFEKNDQSPGCLSQGDPMYPIRVMVTVATAGILALGAMLVSSPQLAAGGVQEPANPVRQPRGDDLLPKGIVVHADPPNAEPAKTEVTVETAGVQPGYTNFCRVTATPEEVILDAGLNPQPFGAGAQPVKINQRVVMNLYTAKRLMIALETTIRRHEQTFGPIELDVRRRARSFEQRQLGQPIPK
jgi:hypothetical protein